MENLAILDATKRASPQQVVYTVERLAEELGLSAHQIHKKLCGAASGSLPPPIRIPGTRRIYFLADDVRDWLASFRKPSSFITPSSATEAPKAATKRRRGAPTKAERREKRLAQSAAMAGH